MSRGRQFNRGHRSLAAEFSLWFPEAQRFGIPRGASSLRVAACTASPDRLRPALHDPQSKSRCQYEGRSRHTAPTRKMMNDFHDRLESRSHVSSVIPAH
jgi:hypothetical protein